MEHKQLIETPYGRKTPELLCKAMDALEREPELKEVCRALCAWHDAREPHGTLGEVVAMARRALTA